VNSGNVGARHFVVKAVAHQPSLDVKLKILEEHSLQPFELIKSVAPMSCCLFGLVWSGLVWCERKEILTQFL